MSGSGWTEPIALAVAFLIAVIATPAGISGAVLLLPFQVSVLGTPSPAVTPTNLLYNVVATPGALYRYRRQHQAGGRLTRQLTAGTLPGVIAGSVIRVELLPGPRIFALVVAAVLLPLGTWLTATSSPRPADPPRPPRHIPGPALTALACAVGCVGGIYGIGGGSILAPVLISAGRPPTEVAPAALASTFTTSVAGVATFTMLAIQHHGPVAPDWPTGIALGIGGLVGAYTGARLQARLPDILIRHIVGILVIAIAARYLCGGQHGWPGACRDHERAIRRGPPAGPAGHGERRELPRSLERRFLGYQQFRHRFPLRRLTRGGSMADHAGPASVVRPVQALPSRQLAVPWIAVAALAAVAWAVTVMLSRTMGNGPGTMGLALLPFLGLWVVMMAAMMLPSVAPVAVMWTRLITGASAGPGRLLRMSAFLAGYLLARSAAGTVAFAALAGTGRLLTASPAAAKWLGVAVFTAAGIYQLTPWKDWCLRRCRSPIGALVYYLGFKGRSRDVRVGLHHG